MAQLKTRPPSFSTPLPGATLFHPAGKLIFVVVFIPFMAAVAATGAFFAQGTRIPFELPAALAAWALLVPALWRGIQTVRVTEEGIASGRPWQAWREIGWTDVIRVERRGLRIHIVSSQGTRIRFTPVLLHDGADLRDKVLLNVSQSVIQGSLNKVAVRVGLTSRPVSGVMRTEPPSKVQLYPRLRLRLGALFGILISLGAGGVALVALPIIPAIALAICGLVAACVCAVAFCWLSQQVTLSEAGISVQAFPSGRGRGTLWSDVVVVEHTGGWGALRLTSKAGERVPVPGPGVAGTLDAQVYHLYIERRLYGRERGVLVAQRHWLF